MQSVLSVRMDTETKESFARFCEDAGLSVSTAINLFAKQTIKMQKIPFEISLAPSLPRKRGQATKERPSPSLKSSVQLDAKCAEWGISVSSVEIENIFVPKELQDALSRKAQADREREARLALTEAERDVSEIYVEAAEIYQKNTLAVQIRAMNLVNEGVREKGGMVVVPSAYSEGFGSPDDFPLGAKG